MSPQLADALLTLAELSRFLHLGQRTVLKLAREKKIPALQIDGEWRFRRTDIDGWLQKQLHGDEGSALKDVTDGMRVPLGDVLSEGAVISDMKARDALGAIEELAARAYSNNWLADKPWFVGALVERESLASTAMEGGVAFLHTRARDTERISRPFVVVGRSYEGISFGAPDGEKTFLFFLLGLKYDKLHLPILGRLARIMLRDPRTIARLRATTSPTKVRDILQRLDAKEMAAAASGVTTRKAPKSKPVLDRDLRLRTIMRAQARRAYDEKQRAAAEEKAEAKRVKAEAAAERKAETVERRRLAADKRKEAARKKKAASDAKKAKEKEAADKKRAALAKKKKAAAEKKKKAAAKKKAAEKKKAAAEKKKAAAAKKKAAAAKKKAAAAKKKRKSSRK